MRPICVGQVCAVIVVRPVVIYADVLGRPSTRTVRKGSYVPCRDSQFVIVHESSVPAKRAPLRQQRPRPGMLLLIQAPRATHLRTGRVDRSR